MCTLPRVSNIVQTTLPFLHQFLLILWPSQFLFSSSLQHAVSTHEYTKRSFSNLEPQILRLLYTTIIRPHLDYGCVVWNPYQSSDIRVLEHVR